jgi:plastocyanin
MQFSTFPLLLAALPLALATPQYGDTNADASTTSSAAATQTSSGSSATHTVTVGNGALAFDPPSLTANPGEKVEFHFYPKTHSVAQASFAKPCVPLNSTSFFSGGFTTASGVNSSVFTITVEDETPIWYYCGYPGHCGAGMVGAINPTANKTFDEFQAAAKGLNTTAPLKVQGGVISQVSTSSATTSGGSTSSSSTSSPSATSSKSAGISEIRGRVGWMGISVAVGAAVGVGALMG